jgi:hypothetical protein
LCGERDYNHSIEDHQLPQPKKLKPGYSETTSDDFRSFIDECEYWIDRYGLRGWETKYSHECTEGYYATTSWDSESRHVTFNISTIVPDIEYTPYDIALSAFHEVTELLMYKIHMYSQEYDIKPERTIEDVHEIIRILENTFFRPDWNFRKYGQNITSGGMTKINVYAPIMRILEGKEDGRGKETEEDRSSGVGSASEGRTSGRTGRGRKGVPGTERAVHQSTGNSYSPECTGSGQEPGEERMAGRASGTSCAARTGAHRQVAIRRAGKVGGRRK